MMMKSKLYMNKVIIKSKLYMNIVLMKTSNEGIYYRDES